MVRKRESVPVPTKREASDAGKQLRKGHPSAGRVLSEVAKADKRYGKPKSKR